MHQRVTWKLYRLSVQQAETQRSIHSYASRIELRDQLHAFASTIFARKGGGGHPLGHGRRRRVRSLDHPHHPELGRHQTTQYLFVFLLRIADVMRHVATVAPCMSSDVTIELNRGMTKPNRVGK